MKALTWLHWSSVALVALSLGGCKSLLKKRVPVAAPSDSAPVAAAPLPSPAAPPAVVAPAAVDSAVAAAANDESIPAPEDFEDEAFAKVTATNFKAEFARLQKEVTSK